MNGRIWSRKDRVESAIARGERTWVIAERLRMTEEKVLEIADAMDTAAAHTDDPRADFGDTCRKGLHALTPDNTYRDPQGRRVCRPCKEDHRRAAYQREKAS